MEGSGNGLQDLQRREIPGVSQARPAAGPGASVLRVIVVVGAAVVTSLLGITIYFVITGMIRQANTPWVPPTTAPAAQPAPRPVDPDFELAKTILVETTFEGAIRVAKPRMTDTVENPSRGASVLMGWALANQLRWADVAPKQDETSIALVQKDSARERGKRLCAPGQIIEIHVQRGDLGVFANGLLLSEAGNLVHFLAARDTGELVAESPARFCGVVTGTLDYRNSVGGVGHAVQMVGMFDLPANRAAPKAR